MKVIIFGMGKHSDVVVQAIIHELYWEIIRTDDQHPVEYQVGDHAFAASGDAGYREKCSKAPLQFINIIHPRAHVFEPVFGRGIFIAAGATVCKGAIIGDFTIINTNASLDHHSQVGAFSHLAPGVVTGGRVHIGHHTMIGIGAMIRDGVTIGNNCTIGMGSVVLDDIPDNSRAWGNPCKVQP